MAKIPRRMPGLSRLTSLASATALALGLAAATPQPAQAGDDALFKFIVGATALGIIAHGLSRPSHAAPRHHHGHAYPVAPAACRVTYYQHGRRHTG